MSRDRTRLHFHLSSQPSQLVQDIVSIYHDIVFAACHSRVQEYVLRLWPVILLTEVLKVLVGIKLWKNRSSFRSVRIQGWISIQLLARLGIFQIYSLLVLV